MHPRRVRAEAPCGGLCAVVSPLPYWLTTALSGVYNIQQKRFEKFLEIGKQSHKKNDSKAL